MGDQSVEQFEEQMGATFDSVFGKLIDHEDLSKEEAITLANEAGVKAPGTWTAKQWEPYLHSEGGAVKVELAPWQAYLDDHTQFDKAKLMKYFEKNGLVLGDQYVGWVLKCFDLDKSGTLSGRREMQEVRKYVLQTTLQKRWAYYGGWLLANAGQFVVGSVAVNAANRYYLDESVTAAKGCNVEELATLEGAIRLLGSVVITEAIIFYLVPVCGSCCPIPWDVPKSESDKAVDIPLTARTGSIMFLKGVRGIGAARDGCGEEFGFAYFFIDILLALLWVTMLVTLITTTVLVVMTSSCTVAPNNRDLYMTALHSIIVLWTVPLWSTLTRCTSHLHAPLLTAPCFGQALDFWDCWP